MRRKYKFGDVFICSEGAGSLIYVRDNRIFRCNQKCRVGELIDLTTFKNGLVDIKVPTFGNNKPIVWEKQYSTLTINFEDIYIEDIGLASEVTVESKPLDKTKIWANASNRTYPYSTFYSGKPIKRGDALPDDKYLCEHFPRIDYEFDPDIEWETNSREVLVTEHYVYKRGATKQQRAEIYYSLVSSNPLFVPVISVFEHEGETVIVQPRIKGTPVPAIKAIDQIYHLFGTDFLWEIPLVGYTFYDGLTLYAGSNNVIFEDKIPWIYDLGEILVRDKHQVLSNDWLDRQGSFIGAVSIFNKPIFKEVLE